MTKAERIFKDTYYRCMNHIQVWGEERNPDGRLIGFNTLIMNQNESACTRTFNAVEKEIEKQKRQIALWEKYGMGMDKNHLRRMAIEMVEVTLENTKKNYQ